MATIPDMATPEDPPEATIPGAGLEPQDAERQQETEQRSSDEKDSLRDGYSIGGTVLEKRRVSIKEHAAARLPAEVLEK